MFAISGWVLAAALLFSQERPCPETLRLERERLSERRDAELLPLLDAFLKASASWDPSTPPLEPVCRKLLLQIARRRYLARPEKPEDFVGRICEESSLGCDVLKKAAPVPAEDSGFQWGSALKQSFLFLAVEHGFRMSEEKTRGEFAGPFWRDYLSSVRNLGGWDDGGHFHTNYIGHPMQGSISGFIQIQNDPRGRMQEFSWSKDYWMSRLKAMGWSAVYSTYFELGFPFSEAALGNVGLKPGKMTYGDLVITPALGTAWLIGEDALDRTLVRWIEGKTDSPAWRAVARGVLNPTRSFANLLRFKPPWHRDVRGLDDLE